MNYEVKTAFFFPIKLYFALYVSITILPLENKEQVTLKQTEMFRIQCYFFVTVKDFVQKCQKNPF